MGSRHKWNILTAASTLYCRFFPGVTMEALAQYPKMKALRDKVASHDKIVPMYADKDNIMYASFKP